METSYAVTRVKRRRLPFAERRDQLLDVTRSLILTHGLNSFTMETLTREAGVSKPLAYKYFSTRLDLLQTLLMREYQQQFDYLDKAFNDAPDFIDIIRIAVTSDFDRHSEGDIVKILRSQSDVDEILKPILKDSDGRLGRRLVAEFTKEYEVEQGQAQRLLRMASGASLAAADRYTQQGGDKEQLITEAVQFIFGGIDAILKR